MKIVDRGILYRNPRPEKESIHAYFADTVQLSASEFISTYWRTPESLSAEGRLMQSRSTDSGQTWQDEGLVYDLSGDDRLFSYRGHHLLRLSDGTLLLTANRWDRSDPEKPYYNPKTEGYLPCDITLFRSTDLGHTWSGPQVVPLPDAVIGNMSGPTIELPDGSLLLPCETWKSWDDPSPAPLRTFALFSRDGGATWGEMTSVADGMEEGIYYGDQRIINLDDARLLAVFWTHNFVENKDLPIHISYSENNGRTWSDPISTAIPGQVCGPVNVGGGRVFLAYNLRFGDRPGIVGIISNDNGASWNFDSQVMIWDPLARRDAANVSEDKTIASSLTDFTFGKPNTIRLMDGCIMVSFWSTVDGVTDVRWAKLEL